MTKVFAASYQHPLIDTQICHTKVRQHAPEDGQRCRRLLI